MRYMIMLLPILFPFPSFAGCGDERREFMTQNDMSAASSLIACLEGELAEAKQAAVASPLTSSEECPPFPVIPVGPSTPGNPQGSEAEIYAFLKYYRAVTNIDDVNWMAGAASALNSNDAAALVSGTSGSQFCSGSLPTYELDWNTGQYIDAGNGLGVILYPEARGLFEHK